MKHNLQHDTTGLWFTNRPNQQGFTAEEQADATSHTVEQVAFIRATYNCPFTCFPAPPEFVLPVHIAPIQ